jgi:hypothetical protein
MFCGKCGTEVPEEFAFCTKCGGPVQEVPRLSEAAPEKGGASKVSRWRTILLVLSLVSVMWVGSAGIAYGVVELTGGGPQGEQGEQGLRGTRGATGPAGSSGTDFGTSLALERLAEMWAVERLRYAGDHPQVQACVDYVMDGTGSFAECGFERAD